VMLGTIVRRGLGRVNASREASGCGGWHLGARWPCRLDQGAEKKRHSASAGESTMTYRVYSGPRGSDSISPIEKDRHLFKEFEILDEAMSWARHINSKGRVALLVEGDDGTYLTKQQIASTLKGPNSQDADRSSAA
jgi:hypothetical protein